MKVKLDSGAYMPVRAHDTDAGLDLKTHFDVIVPPMRKREYIIAGRTKPEISAGAVSINTGVHVEIPHGYYGKIESKSGLNVKHGIVACGGVIDEGYTGAIVVRLYNLSSEEYRFRDGDKIAQLIIQPYVAPELELVDELSNTPRGDGGFGSTGK